MMMEGVAWRGHREVVTEDNIGMHRPGWNNFEDSQGIDCMDLGPGMDTGRYIAWEAEHWSPMRDVPLQLLLQCRTL